MKKNVIRIASLLFIATVSYLVLTAIFQTRRTSEAHKIGFDEMYSTSAKGLDGMVYSVKVYWDRMRSIPGTNRILVRIAHGNDRVYDQTLSTDRVWLTDVWLRRHADSDDLMFRIDNLAGKPNDYSNKVSKSGLIGYAQQIQTEQDAATNP